MDTVDIIENIYYEEDIELFWRLVDNGDNKKVIYFLCKDCNFRNIILKMNAKLFPLYMVVDVPIASYRQDLVTHLLSKGVDSNIVDDEGYSSLYYAVVRKNLVAVKNLLHAGANTNRMFGKENIPDFLSRFRKRDNNRTFLLHVAVTAVALTFQSSYLIPPKIQQKYAVVEELLKHGADCNFLDFRGSTPLHYAVSQNDEHMATILLDAGADANLQSHEQLYTPLFLASDASMVKLLLSRNADPEMRCESNDSLLHVSIYTGIIDVTAYIVSDMVTLLDTKNVKQESPLTVALLFGNMQAAYLLMQAGCDPASELLTIDHTYTCWMFKEKGRDLLIAMEELASNPRQLEDLCVFSIRRSIRSNIITAADSLPLPTKLKKKIALDIPWSSSSQCQPMFTRQRRLEYSWHTPLHLNYMCKCLLPVVP